MLVTFTMQYAPKGRSSLRSFFLLFNRMCGTGVALCYVVLCLWFGGEGRFSCMIPWRLILGGCSFRSVYHFPFSFRACTLLYHI